MAGGTTKGVQVLYTLFMGQPIKKGGEQFYDFLSYYFYMRVKEKKQLPNEASLSGIYGEFLRGPEVTNILQNEYFDVSDREYDVKLRAFRKDALKEIVIFIDPTYPEDYEDDFISLSDISYFFQQIAKTKIWNDQTIRKNEALIRELANSVSRKNFLEDDDVDNYYISNAGEFDDVDWMNPEIPMTKAYEYLEKENWKKYVLDEFKPYVDALDLTAFKKLLKDPLKRHFLPRGWQAEFLLRHKRFNRIGASRRAGKCIEEGTNITLWGGGNKLAKDIKVGDKLLASDGEGYITVFAVEYYLKATVKISTIGDKTLVVTRDHRIPTRKNFNGKEWSLKFEDYIQAEDLVIGDEVAILDNDNKIGWDRIKSIEVDGVHRVVDIEASGDHLYWANGILSHNTFLGAGYLAGRQLMLPMQTVVYVVPTLKNHARPAWKALSHYFGDCTEFKMNKSDFSIVNKETKSEMYFVTAERGDSVRGNAANLMIFDEASFIDEEVFETAIPLIRTTRGMVYGISTVNPKTPKNWFYYKLIDAEVNGYDPDSDSYARRIDLWHNPFIPDDEKQLIYKDGMRNPNAFNCEWMVNFADKDSFDLSKFWIIDEDPKEITIDGVFTELWRGEAITKEIFQTYPTFMVAYDGAKRKDMPGITVYGIKPTGGIDMVMSGYLEGLDYYQQVDVVYEIYKMLGGEKRCEILMDYGGAGIAVHEIFIQQKGVYPLRFQSVGGLYEGKEDGIYKVGKEALVGMAKAQVALGNVRGYSFMRKLAIEFETYTEDIKRLGTLDNHWDMISSMMIAIYWANKQGYLEKKEPTKAQQAWDGEFAQYNNPELFSMSPDEVESAFAQTNPYERYERFGY